MDPRHADIVDGLHRDAHRLGGGLRLLAHGEIGGAGAHDGHGAEGGGPGGRLDHDQPRPPVVAGPRDGRSDRIELVVRGASDEHGPGGPGGQGRRGVPDLPGGLPGPEHRLHLASAELPVEI